VQLDYIRKALAEKSLADFIKQGWRNMDPSNFISNWHIDAICEHLEAVSRGEIKRLIINVPPRHMKSLSVSVAWPAWTWAQAENKDMPLMGAHVRFLAASYAQSLSTRDNVKCRRLIQSQWYRDNWGDRFDLTGDQNTKIRFENDHQGYRIATSVDGTATGEGGDVIIVDDALSAGDAGSPVARNAVTEWWDGTMSTRLNDPKTGAFAIIMQRLHQNDLVGHILDREPGDWTMLCLPARYESDHPHVYPLDIRSQNGALLWPARMGETEVKKLETTLGSYGAAGQLQQRPAPREGGMFKRHWFKIVEAAPAGLRFVRAWDLAASVPKVGSDPDYTVGLKMGKDAAGNYWIVDVVRDRISALAVEQLMLSTATQDTISTTIKLSQDPGQAGKGQVQQQVRMLAGYTVKAAPETGSKEVRAEAFAAQCEAGNVSLVKGLWVPAFLDEIEVFPFGSHDDQVDTAANAFNELALGSDMYAFIQSLNAQALATIEGANQL
jgi:predicted phage terminase large subunit-like protein